MERKNELFIGRVRLHGCLLGFLLVGLMLRYAPYKFVITFENKFTPSYFTASVRLLASVCFPCSSFLSLSCPSNVYLANN